MALATGPSRLAPWIFLIFLSLGC